MNGQPLEQGIREDRQMTGASLPTWPSVLLGLGYVFLLGIAYAFGLFEMIGPGLLQSVDKVGLFGHLAFYGGLYAVVALLLTATMLLIMVIGFLVLRLFGIGFQVPTLFTLQMFLLLWGIVVVIDVVDFILVLPIFLCLLIIWGLVRASGGAELGRLTIIGILPILAFGLGLLNGVRIADAPSSIQVSLRGNPSPMPGQIVMSTSQGIVFFNRSRGEAIYLPYGSVEIASATEGQLGRMNDNRAWAKSLIVRLETTLKEFGWNRVKTAFDELRSVIIRQFQPKEIAPQEQVPRRIG
ncbi:MAG: hypothetical protein AAF346_13070 [Pseudomonadota bacterium]